MYEFIIYLPIKRWILHTTAAHVTWCIWSYIIAIFLVFVVSINIYHIVGRGFSRLHIGIKPAQK